MSPVVKAPHIYACKICRNMSGEVTPEGTGLCDNCWEIDRRIGRLDLEALSYFFYTIRDELWKKEA